MVANIGRVGINSVGVGSGSELFDDPNLAFTKAHAVPPPTFSIRFSTDKKTLIYVLKATGSPFATKSFRVYFASISLASPATIARPQTAYNVFQQSAIVGTADAPPSGTAALIRDSISAGFDGWFFAVSVNLNNVESQFVGPLRNPIVGTSDSRVPPDVVDQSVTLADGGLDPWGRQLVEVTCEAKMPGQDQGISNIQVTAGGTGYTSAPTVSFTGGGGGSGATAVAKLNGDAVFEVDIITAGTGYTENPVVVFTGGGGTGATAQAFLTATGSFAGYQIYIQNYFSAGIVDEGPFFANGSSTPGNVLRGKFLLLQDTPPAHPVVFYFVSLSQTGTRRDDPTSAPSVTFAGGIEP